jgi:hypothetical protein
MQQRPRLTTTGLFGPMHHTVRFFKTGLENVLVLDDARDNGGLPFFLCDEDP